jgi:hypothetical protein
MPTHPTPQDQLNPQYGTELLLVTVGSVLLVVALVAIASTSVALIVLAVVATSALAVVIAALVLRMTSDPGEGRAPLSRATRPERPRAARPRAQAHPIVAGRVSHTHVRARIRRKGRAGNRARDVFQPRVRSGAVRQQSSPGTGGSAPTRRSKRRRRSSAIPGGGATRAVRSN